MLETSSQDTQACDDFSPGTRVKVKARESLDWQEGLVLTQELTSDSYDVLLGSGRFMRANASQLWRERQHDLSSLEAIPGGRADDMDQSPPSNPRQTTADALSLAPGVAVSFVGVKTQPALNVQRGTLVEFVDTDGRWRVRMADGSCKSFRPANLTPSSVDDGRAACSAKVEDSASPAISIGAIVRVRGLSAKPALNGKEGPVIEYDKEQDRWVVDIRDGQKRLLASNLEVLRAAPVWEPLPPQFVSQIASLVDASSVLDFCTRRSGDLTIADFALALQRSALMPDRHIMNSDPRMPALLARLRELLSLHAAPCDIAEVLEALVELDFRPAPLLEDIKPCVVRQLSRFGSEDLVRAVESLAELDQGDLELFDAFAREALRSAEKLTGRESLRVAQAFAKLKLRHFEMLDALASRCAEVLGSFSDLDLGACAATFWGLGVLDAGGCATLRRALAAEAVRRIAGLGEEELARLALALAAQEPAAAEVLATRAEAVRPTGCALAALLSALPQLRASLGVVCRQRAHEASLLLRAACVITAEHPSKVALEALRAGELAGLYGTRCVLDEIGVRCCGHALVERATNRISWASTCVGDWHVCTAPARRFACAEYRLTGDGGTPPVEGCLVRHGSEPIANFELMQGYAVDTPSSCALWQVACELWALIPVTPVGSTSLAIAASQTSGGVHIFLSDTPTPEGLLALQRLRVLLPRVAFSATAGEVADLDGDDEVITFDFGIESVEVVD